MEKPKYTVGDITFKILARNSTDADKIAKELGKEPINFGRTLGVYKDGVPIKAYCFQEGGQKTWCDWRSLR